MLEGIKYFFQGQDALGWFLFDFPHVPVGPWADFLQNGQPFQEVVLNVCGIALWHELNINYYKLHWEVFDSTITATLLHFSTRFFLPFLACGCRRSVWNRGYSIYSRIWGSKDWSLQNRILLVLWNISIFATDVFFFQIHGSTFAILVSVYWPLQHKN